MAKVKAKVAVDPQKKLKNELARLVAKIQKHTDEIAVQQDKLNRANIRKGEVEAEIAALVAKLVAPVA